MKFEPLYKCAICGELIGFYDIPIDIPESRVDNESWWLEIVKGSGPKVEQYGTSWVFHRCGNYKIGMAHFAGFAPIEEAGE